MTLAIRPWVVGVPALALIPHRDAWSYCKRAICAAVGGDAYDAWFGSLALVEVRPRVLRLSVASQFLQMWITSHYAQDLLVACQSEWPTLERVEVSARSCVVKDLRSVPGLMLPAPPPAPRQVVVLPHVRLFPYTPDKLFPGHPACVWITCWVKVRIEDIQRVVARHYKMSRSDMLSSSRKVAIAHAQQVAMYLAKVLTGRSLPEIAHRFDGRDHTTVLHAVDKIAWLVGDRRKGRTRASRKLPVEIDTVLADEVELLKQQLQK